MAKDIRQSIEAQITTMTSAQRKVADYILDDIMEAAFSTIDKIAHAAGVSTMSVIRLANSLGYHTFSEFQNELKEYIRSNAAPVHKFSLEMHTAQSRTEDTETEVYNYVLDNIRSAVQSIDSGQLDSAAQTLANARNIYICGVRTCESVARYLTFNLNRMFLNANYVGESLSEQLDLYKQISPEDVLIAATVSRYNKVVCNTAALCMKKNVPVIALTDSYDSPLIPASSYQFIGKCRSNSFHNSVIALIFLCDSLIRTCGQINQDRVRENLSKDEEMLSEFQFFMRK